MGALGRASSFFVLVACASEPKPPPPAPAPAPAPSPPPPAEPAVAEGSAAADGSGGQPTEEVLTPRGGKPPDPGMVAPNIAEGYRVEGSKMIAPDDLEKVKMVEKNLSRVTASAKLCIAVDGTISSVKLLVSSGLPGYDHKILDEIKTTWRYKPVEINGKPAPICTAVTFIYKQKPRN